ncbi:MAG: class I poly(R)-hydroxyalkanoic acid synthase [Alphaproteobacteria bacterium]|nr:class I poly(R)-hydroxyalkanoic acid synthase [Alphaproteobacteria bacterium]
MADQPASDQAAAAGEAFLAQWRIVSERSQALIGEFLKRQQQAQSPLNPLAITQAFVELTQRMMADPAKALEAQREIWAEYLKVWQNVVERAGGKSDTKPYVEADKGDRRFKDAAWQDNQLFDFLKQSYLLTSRWLQRRVANTEGLDDKTRHKIDFYTRQLVDAMSPSNFVGANPEVLRATYESGGDNLVKGLDNLLADLERGGITMSDPNAFIVGENVAVTPGKVVYQNRIIQLLQYSPTTKQVHRLPLLIIPPWINKCYVLDLRPKNSFVRWLVDQGFTVFMVSWVNPDPDFGTATFEDYLREGFLAATDAVRRITGEAQMNLVGYCAGGTLTAAALAHLAAKNDDRVAAATFMTALIDFREAGDITVFIDDEQLRAIDEHMQKKGVFEGRHMAQAFNMLRANDLIWSFVVQNYLLGKEPLPFDLLSWNADSANLPAAMHSYYLRRMYHENQLIVPGGLTLLETPIDLRRIALPSYVLATKEDHIAPWKSCYVATQTFSGPRRFVLAQSGHVAGVVNPPDAGKYGHWTNDALPAAPDQWLATATAKAGSWWPDWVAWLARQSGDKVAARAPKKGIEEAPGSYVKKKATANAD